MAVAPTCITRTPNTKRISRPTPAHFAVEDTCSEVDTRTVLALLGNSRPDIVGAVSWSGLVCALLGLQVLDDATDQGTAALVRRGCDGAPAAMLECERRVREHPALTLRPDQVLGGHAHVVEEDEVLAAAELPHADPVHALDRDAGGPRGAHG